MAIIGMSAGSEGARAGLTASGHLRVSDAVSASVVSVWAELAEDGDACPVLAITEALSGLGPLEDIGWWDEASGLPARSAFVLDLTDRPSEQGGLLLVPEGDGRVMGWRPEAGALTVFGAGKMLLSPVRQGAPRRLAVVGILA